MRVQTKRGTCYMKPHCPHEQPHEKSPPCDRDVHKCEPIQEEPKGGKIRRALEGMVKRCHAQREHNAQNRVWSLVGPDGTGMYPCSNCTEAMTALREEY